MDSKITQETSATNTENMKKEDDDINKFKSIILEPNGVVAQEGILTYTEDHFKDIL